MTTPCSPATPHVNLGNFKSGAAVSIGCRICEGAQPIFSCFASALTAVISPVTRVELLSQASRRQFLHAACVHYARELVIADGWSRLGPSEIAAALQCV